MYVIGLTGGIASGKSTVARRLSHHGAVHIDADALARDVVAPGTPGLAEIRDGFGESVLNSDGSLNRSRLGSVVFGDPDALRRLNAIVHPAVRRLSAERIAAAGAADENAVVVYDVPLLVEGGIDDQFNTVVVVHADEKTRVARLVELRGMSPDDARARVGSQASDADRLEIADVVIDSSGTLEHTLEQTDRLWAEIPAQ